ncbi:MAG: hypothetical protein H7322_15075 [Ramlibacter sp.]|nr:hypothetical protein [Ramlibacter sp.]
MKQPDGGVVSTIASPLRLSETPPAYVRTPPALGDSTDQVLREVLAYDAQQIAALRDSRVV